MTPRIAAGDSDGASQLLQDCLDATQGAGYDDSDGLDAEGGSTVAHGAPAGAIVPARTAEQVYELIRSLPATAASNEALSLLEPLLQSTPAEEERGTPKPETSTSGIKLDSDEGLELQKRWRALRDSHRP